VSESEGEQESRLGFSLAPDRVSFEVDETVYPLEAIYGACYLFLEKCFVYLSRPRPQVVDVRLTSRESAKPAELEALAGEFANELLSQAVRLRLSQATARIREYYTAAALRAAASAPSIDDLLAELESEELGEDPLEIMVPWEEKHGTEEKNGTKEDETKAEKDPDMNNDA
jgi:His-Xaa-Ser system protein HxsD